MSVQDIVEAYETRLRERWTPDGEPVRPAVILTGLANGSDPNSVVWKEVLTDSPEFLASTAINPQQYGEQ